MASAGSRAWPPAGYERTVVRGIDLVARTDALAAGRTALKSGTLYEYAAQHEDARPLAGRGIAYAVPFPNGERVVVRHNQHGGLLAPLTRDRFLTPTRAPHELRAAVRLAAANVPTPEIIAYAVYPAGPLLRRSDVVTREIRDARDLAAILTSGIESERRAALDGAATLIGALSAVGARHHDLNVKNILVARSGSRATPAAAYVLDVDRVEFGRPGDSSITELNLARFVRSARKWRELHDARIEDAELVRIAAAVRTVVGSRPSGGRPSTTRS